MRSSLVEVAAVSTAASEGRGEEDEVGGEEEVAAVSVPGAVAVHHAQPSSP